VTWRARIGLLVAFTLGFFFGFFAFLFVPGLTTTTTPGCCEGLR
jgi:hypothetical protein